MAKICMNEACRVTATIEWKNGWGLKSGGFATLCFNCGSAYENLIYCETFHLEESGWRDCRLCGKRIHCGCIASKHLHDILDFGGVGCISCTKSLEAHSMRPIKIQSDGISNGFGPLPANNIGDPQSSFVANRMGGISVDKGKIVQLSKTMDAKELGHFPQTPRTNNNSSIGQIKREEIMLPIAEGGTSFPEMMQQSVGPSIFVKPENSRPILGVKDMYESPAQPSLGFSLGSPLDTSNSRVPSSPSGVMEGTEQNKVPPIQQGQRARTILPKPVKTGLTIGAEANKGMFAQTRVPRPPADGRGRSQLLPRYWPRITDQELQQISGDLNSTIVPLFEKVLSASDAGRIGRLVLPKACAEAYFPPISQSDGLPIRVQDIKGKEWTFQFRFWPNNNSRMYVLEGVTPCMQNMQLQAGDTVTFSRIDPGGKLVMGFRKSNYVDMQDGQTSALANGVSSGEAFVSGVNDNLPTHGGRTNEDSSQQLRPIPEKKRNRNIGSKSKRLLLHNEEAMELRLTWEEAQELLRPPPSAKPTVVMIDDHEFEEYDEPPVFGKKTTFIVRESGEPDQWAQCDSCSKWRRLPVDVLLPPKWTCLDNIWDLSRCSCSAADEMNPNELGCLLGVSKDFKKRRNTESAKVTPEYESSGLDALATAAVLGENAVHHPNDLVPSLELQVCRKNGKLDQPNMASPRLFRTHISYSLLPESIKTSSCKIVYITRDPKDLSVSLWHFMNTQRSPEQGPFPFNEAFESFCNGFHSFGPFHEHVLQFWNESLKSPQKILFLKYEDLKRDPKGEVLKLASFLGRPLANNGEAEKIVRQCSIERLKNLEVNRDGVDPWSGFPKSSYFRLGLVGDWKNKLSTEMKDRLDEITRVKFEGSGLSI